MPKILYPVTAASILFHDHNVKIPMQILKVEEVRQLAGLQCSLTSWNQGNALFTEKVIRDSLIDAVLGPVENVRAWVDQQIIRERRVLGIDQTHRNYQELLRPVQPEASKTGVSLTANNVDIEAKWHKSSADLTSRSTVIPKVHQPLLTSVMRSLPSRIMENPGTCQTACSVFGTCTTVAR